MWWRAAAAGGVLAIYLLCVLLLSGLQKDDLDVNIIKKLQRHNINIDIIDNEEKRQECLQSLKNQNHSIEVKKGRHNSFDKVNFTTKLVELPTERVSRKTSDTDATRIWTLLRRISTKKGKETKNTAPTTTTTTTEKPKHKSKSTKDSMEYISKIIESYLAMTKTVPTTTPTTVNFKGMMDEIKKLLAMNNYQQRELFRTATMAPTTVTQASKLTPVTTTTPTTTAKSEVDTGLIKLLNIAISKFDTKTERPLRLMPPANPNQLPYEVTTQEHTLKVFKKDENNANMTEVLVHDIAENVKDIVLKELKKDILTTTARYAVTRRTTANPESVTDVTMALAQFMEMFQKYKNVNDNVLEQRTQATTSNVINKPKELAVYRSPPSVQYKPPIVRITAKKILPIGNPHIIQNIPVNFGSNILPQPVRAIQRPQQQQPQQPQQQQLQLQLQEQQIGYYNKSPMTVQQTNRDVIPPLKIPLQSPLLVYQNIMITTERSLNRFEFKKQDYNIYEDKINKDYDKKLHSMINNYKPHQLIREYANEGRGRLHGYKDYSSHLSSGREKHKYGRLREVAKYKDISDEPPRWAEERHGRNAYKYHEELERVDDYPRQHSRERHHKKIRKMKMSSRKLRPIHESKNHSRYDDTHFINFLKTQQKVNDMLERILATKTISDKPTSAETA